MARKKTLHGIETDPFFESKLSRDQKIKAFIQQNLNNGAIVFLIKGGNLANQNNEEG